MDDSKERAVLDNLIRSSGENKVIPNALVASAAAALGCSPRTVRRKLAEWKAGGGAAADARLKAAKWTAGEAEVQLLYDSGGIISEAYRRYREATATPVSLETFRRGLHATIPNDEWAAITGGHKAFQQNSLVLHNPDGVLHRNQLWETDYCELTVRARHVRGRVKRRVSMIVVADAATRKIVGWALVFDRRPDRGDVLAALGHAVRTHGVPGAVRCDNGMQFLAKDVQEVTLTLGAAVIPTAAYSPEQKGKVERVQQTLKQMIALRAPGAVDGPRAKDGRLYGDDVLPITIAALACEVEEVVAEYHRRVHGSLNGLTPSQAWDADPTELVFRDPAELRWMLLAKETRKVTKYGLRFRNHWYQHPEIAGLVGERLVVAFIPGDPAKLEVHRDDSWLCTAEMTETMTDELRTAIIERRAAQKKLAGLRRGKATRKLSREARKAEERSKRDARVKPITPGSPLEAVPTMTSDELAVSTNRMRRPRVEARTLTDLLTDDEVAA
jgi:putative transposase